MAVLATWLFGRRGLPLEVPQRYENDLEHQTAHSSRRVKIMIEGPLRTSDVLFGQL